MDWVVVWRTASISPSSCKVGVVWVATPTSVQNCGDSGRGQENTSFLLDRRGNKKRGHRAKALLKFKKQITRKNDTSGRPMLWASSLWPGQKNWFGTNEWSRPLGAQQIQTLRWFSITRIKHSLAETFAQHNVSTTRGAKKHKLDQVQSETNSG